MGRKVSEAPKGQRWLLGVAMHRSLYGGLTVPLSGTCPRVPCALGDQNTFRNGVCTEEKGDWSGESWGGGVLSLLLLVRSTCHWVVKKDSKRKEPCVQGSLSSCPPGAARWGRLHLAVQREPPLVDHGAARGGDRRTGDKAILYCGL